MARSRHAPVANADSEFAEIIAWYEELLERTAPPVGLRWEPIKVGPTWQWAGGWILPDFSLGWRVLAWCGVWLRDKRGRPWQFTPEQARFVLWFFAVDEAGGFLYHSAVLQRLKGWGKDPVAACLAVAAMFADVTFDHWDGDVPVGREEPNAWVQLVAVSREQTQNTMKLFPGLISAEARKRYGIQVGKESVYGLADTRQIQAVTSSPLALEGNRPTLIVRNETQNWTSSNGGHEMAGAIEGNAAKSEDGAARMLDICNAYRPGRDSVGQRTREAWEGTQGDRPTTADFGLLYDSLEAPPAAPLSAEAAPDVIEAIRGDATWLSTKRIMASILNPTNAPSESRRKWYNQITAEEDAWARLEHFDACGAPADVRPVLDGEEVVLFFDGSKSDDATGLMACCMSDGHVVTIQMWQAPPAVRGIQDWTVNRHDVDAEVERTFERFEVIAFWGDPSHTRDDETQERYWDALMDEWHRRYKDRLKLWAVPGKAGHAVMWDMASPARTEAFTAAAERCVDDIEASARAAAEGARRGFTHDADPRLRAHVRNAKRYPNRYGVSLWKGHRESAKKVDLAVCTVGARMVRREVLNVLGTKKRSGRAAFA